MIPLHRSAGAILVLVSLSASLAVVATAAAAGPWEGHWRLDRPGAINVTFPRGGVTCVINPWVDVDLAQNGEKVTGTWTTGYHSGKVTGIARELGAAGSATCIMPAVGSAPQATCADLAFNLSLTAGGTQCTGVWSGGKVKGTRTVPPKWAPTITLDGKVIHQGSPR